MSYSQLVAAVIRRMLRPRGRNFAAYASILVITVAFVALLVVFVVDQLTSSPPVLADVDIQVVIIEEHHEGN